MENQLEKLRQALLRMEIVTVKAAVEKTGLKREAILDFVKSDSQLRIFDEQKQVWINENAEGHC